MRDAARWWLFIALAGFAWLGVGEVRAQDYSSCLQASATSSAYPCPNKADAFAGAKAAAHYAAQAYNIVTITSEGIQSDSCYLSTCTLTYQVTGIRGGGQTAQRLGQRTYPAGSICPDPDMQWNSSTNSCSCSAGRTYYQGQCRTCQSLNGEAGFVNQPQQSMTGESMCIAGCERGFTGAKVCSVVLGSTLCSGTLEWRESAACNVAPPHPTIPDVASTPPPEKQACTPAGDGQTFCIKANGQHCATASTGREICWGPGEVGEKGDGPVLQVKGPGSTAPTPSSMTTHGGDTLTGPKAPITSLTTVGSHSITTTIANYTTAQGTDAKPINSGQPEGSDGQDDDETPGSASGGGDCESPPIVSDPALEMIANQAWATRCAVEAGNAVNASGDIGDCSQPFSVEGTHANAVQLRALRAQICGLPDGVDGGQVDGVLSDLQQAITDAAGDGDFDQGAYDQAANPENWQENRNINQLLDSLDSSGFVSTRSCPIAANVNVAGQSLGLNFQPLCDLFINLSFLLLTLAYFVAIRIVAGVK